MVDEHVVPVGMEKTFLNGNNVTNYHVVVILLPCVSNIYLLNGRMMLINNIHDWYLNGKELFKKSFRFCIVLVDVADA